MAAVMTSEAGNPDKVAEAVAECRRLGVEVRPPDVEPPADSASPSRTSPRTAEHGHPLRPLRGQERRARAPSRCWCGAREAEPATASRDLADFCRRVDLRQMNKRALESLIKAGALDAFGERAALLAGLDTAMSLAQQHQRAQQSGQTSLFDLIGHRRRRQPPR